MRGEIDSLTAQLQLAFWEGTNQLVQDAWQVLLSLVYNFWRCSWPVEFWGWPASGLSAN